MNLIDQTRLKLLREEMNSLLEEFSRSLDVRIEVKFDEVLKGDQLFMVGIRGYRLPENHQSAEIKNLESDTEKFARYWNQSAKRRGLEIGLLYSIVELTTKGETQRFRILGMLSTNLNKKHAIVIQHLKSKEIFTTGPEEIKRATRVKFSDNELGDENDPQ